ncbi:ArsC family reductase [Ferruginibacter sp. SUN002]|uniref:ArsC family reductase n=1 Tax=Ferruginibacter sp. SUN002 TaxID=2937789 RepID=UPI003D36987A
MSKIIIYGIPNCDTVKKVFNWFKENKIDFEFHDYKKSGVSKEKLTNWSKQVGWETILNKKSTSWRELSAEMQSKVTNATEAIKLMMQNNSIIKRPVIEQDETIIFVGFDKTKYEQKLL